jgi:hypothetical protein
MTPEDAVYRAWVVLFLSLVLLGLGALQLWSSKTWSSGQMRLVKRSKDPGLFWTSVAGCLGAGVVFMLMALTRLL